MPQLLILYTQYFQKELKGRLLRYTKYIPPNKLLNKGFAELGCNLQGIDSERQQHLDHAFYVLAVKMSLQFEFMVLDHCSIEGIARLCFTLIDDGFVVLAQLHLEIVDGLVGGLVLVRVLFDVGDDLQQIYRDGKYLPSCLQHLLILTRLSFYVLLQPLLCLAFAQVAIQQLHQFAFLLGTLVSSLLEFLLIQLNGFVQLIVLKVLLYQRMDLTRLYPLHREIWHLNRCCIQIIVYIDIGVYSYHMHTLIVMHMYTLIVMHMKDDIGMMMMQCICIHSLWFIIFTYITLSFQYFNYSLSLRIIDEFSGSSRIISCNQSSSFDPFLNFNGEVGSCFTYVKPTKLVSLAIFSPLLDFSSIFPQNQASNPSSLMSFRKDIGGCTSFLSTLSKSIPLKKGCALISSAPLLCPNRSFGLILKSARRSVLASLLRKSGMGTALEVILRRISSLLVEQKGGFPVNMSQRREPCITTHVRSQTNQLIGNTLCPAPLMELCTREYHKYCKLLLFHLCKPLTSQSQSTSNAPMHPKECFMVLNRGRLSADDAGIIKPRLFKMHRTLQLAPQISSSYAEDRTINPKLQRKYTDHEITDEVEFRCALESIMQTYQKWMVHLLQNVSFRKRTDAIFCTLNAFLTNDFHCEQSRQVL